MKTIAKENNYLTLINVFTVDPANQEKLIDLLVRATQTVKKQPGLFPQAFTAAWMAKR